MDDQTTTALKECIAKYWAYSQITDIVTIRGTPIGTTHCALCSLFIRDIFCDGCPVYEHTGKHGCEGTPYGAVSKAKWGSRESLPVAWQDACEVEAKFLESLLP